MNGIALLITLLTCKCGTIYITYILGTNEQWVVTGRGNNHKAIRKEANKTHFFAFGIIEMNLVLIIKGFLQKNKQVDKQFINNK